MALSANTVWEVRTDGNDGNGGGFVTGATGTDRSQQAAAHATLTTASTVHTTTTQINVAVGDYTVAATDVGNIYNNTGGTSTAGPYQITAADTVNNRWTVDRSVGTSGQTVAGSMGGALASIGMLGARVNAGVANAHAYIRSGTYTLTSGTANVSGGVYANTANITCFILGYDATGGRTSWTSAPTIDVGAITTVTVFDVTNAASSRPAIANVLVDGQNNSNITAFDIGGQSGTIVSCEAIDCTVGITLTGANGTQAVSSKTSNCTTGFNITAGNCVCISCWADGGTTGFTTGGSSHNLFVDCIASDCSIGFDGSTSRLLVNCSVDGCTNDGFNTPVTGCLLINCAATNNGGYGIDINGSNTLVLNCATYNNTSGAINAAANGQTIQIGNITLSGDPWVAAASDDYRPNGTASAGASLRKAGLGVLGQTDSRDIGAVQHGDPARSNSRIGI